MMLKKGQKVTVYQDPVTCEKKEGLATLVKKEREDDLCETWQVRFNSERNAYARQINKNIH